MATATSSFNFGTITSGDLTFTNVLVNETDTGTLADISSFIGSSPFFFATSVTETSGAAFSGVEWSGFSTDIVGANEAETLNFTYGVASNTAGQLIDAMDSAYTVDVLSGLGTSYVALEQAFDSNGNLLGSQTFTAGAALPTAVYFTQAQSAITVKVSISESISSAGTPLSALSSSAAIQTFNTVATTALCSIGDIVFLDPTGSGLESGFDSGPGIPGVTVELLNATGTSVLETTTTNASGQYSFNNLVAGTYEVKFVAPSGYNFTTQGVGGTADASINSSANQTTGITGPITLTAGQADHNVEAGLVPAGNGSGGSGGSISILKTPCSVVVNACGQVTYTFAVTNTGTTALTKLTLSDNIGTAAHPDLVTPTAVLKNGFNVGDTNQNGIFNVGETWLFTETVNQISCGTGTQGSVCNTVSGDHLSGGCTAWLSTSFKPTSCANGATYEFQGVKCTISGGGVGATPISETCGNAVVTFSSSCTQPTTTYNAANNCWTTTLPANCNPGNVFISGLPVTVPAGCNLSGATCNWTVDSSSNNCGVGSVTWQGSCQGYQSFNQNGCNGLTNYNQIGVKVCDNASAYGNGGCTTQGSGWNGSGYCAPANTQGNSCGWIGSDNDCAGTAENQQFAGNCGDTGGNQGGSCHFTASGSNLSGGNTAWLSSTFTPTSCNDGATYTFSNITCTISGGGVGKTPLVESVPNATVVFSSSCSQATTVFNAATNTWVTTVPAGSNPGNVYMTGMPVTIPNGCNLDNATVTWSVGQSANNCGSSSLSWQASCQGYSNFDQNGHNGCTDYNQIGVKVCDNTGDYGCGGNLDQGYGWNGSADTGGYWNTSWCGGGWGSGWGGYNSIYSCNGWNGSDSDGAGTAENQNTAAACGGNDNSCGDYFGNNNYGCNYNYGCDGSDGYNYNYSCGYDDDGGSNGSGTLCEGNLDQSQCNGGTLGQITTGIAGAADTVTATATTSTGTTVTASDTKEVEILNSCTNVSVNGTAPTSSLTTIYGGPRTLEFTYNPSNVVSLKQVQAGLGVVTGNNSNTMAFIEISNKSAPFTSGATIYFEGEVTAGEKIYADATTNVLTNTPIAAPNNHFDTTAGADLYAYVFTSQAAFLAGAAPVQGIAYNTSGSQAMHLGDQIGSLTLVGYVGSNGGHLVS